MSKYIFFDIDGTIWDEKNNIPDSTREAISLLKANGHKTFICSGRGRANIASKDLLGLGFDGIIASCGNHIEMDGEILYEVILDEKLLTKSIKVLAENDIPVVFEGPEDHWIDEERFEDDSYIEYLRSQMGEHARCLNGYEKGMRVNKFSAAMRHKENYPKAKAILEQDFTLIEHPEGIVEFIPKGSSKATGIQWICDRFGVAIEDTYAVGDSSNDLDMLKMAGHGIAMGNGSDIAKETAEYITTDIHDDGIYNAMKHYRLI